MAKIVEWLAFLTMGLVCDLVWYGTRLANWLLGSRDTTSG